MYAIRNLIHKDNDSCHSCQLRLAIADKRNSLKQKFKIKEFAKLPWNQYGKLSFGMGEGRFLIEYMCL